MIDLIALSAAKKHADLLAMGLTSVSVDNTNKSITFTLAADGSQRTIYFDQPSDGISIVGIEIKNGHLICLMSDGSEIDAGILPSGGSGGSVSKPLTFDYMPEGYPTKSVQTTMLMEEQEVAFTLGDYFYMAQLTSAFEIVKGQTYTVNWDGTEYECVGVSFSEHAYVLGSLSIIGAGADTGEPFIYVYNIEQAVGMFATLDTAASHTISAKTVTEVITPMAVEFMPPRIVEAIDAVGGTIDNIGTVAHNALSTANNAQSTANNAQSTANNAVKYTASQNLTDAQKQQARTNIGAGTSSFSGNYNDLANKPTIVQGDWDVNNDADMAYIKNRTHYDYTKYTEIPLFENRNPVASSLIKDTYYYGEKTGGSLNITSGNIYKVSCSNGTKYISTCQSVPIPGQALSNTGRVLGNAQLGVNAGYLNGTSPYYPIIDTGEPWCFISYSHTSKNAIISTISNFKIYSLYIQSAHELKQLDEKYIPSTIAKTSDIPTDDHIKELINTALNAIGIAEEGAY